MILVPTIYHRYPTPTLCLSKNICHVTTKLCYSMRNTHTYQLLADCHMFYGAVITPTSPYTARNLRVLLLCAVSPQQHHCLPVNEALPHMMSHGAFLNKYKLFISTFIKCSWSGHENLRYNKCKKLSTLCDITIDNMTLQLCFLTENIQKL